jgi:hypothetical protein
MKPNKQQLIKIASWLVGSEIGNEMATLELWTLGKNKPFHKFCSVSIIHHFCLLSLQSLQQIIHNNT